jgi:hypothetical protein
VAQCADIVSVAADERIFFATVAEMLDCLAIETLGGVPVTQ